MGEELQRLSIGEEESHDLLQEIEFDHEIERTLKALRAQGKITNTCEVKIAENPRALRERDEGKLPSHPIENPRANYHEQAKVVITIRNGKLVDNKVGKPIKDSESNNNENKGISMTKIERKIEKELASSSNFKTLESSPTTSYKPKLPYPEALLPPPPLRKDNKREDILETLKQLHKVDESLPYILELT
ncbi:hypothetical protein M9H77_18063 [Catharanthus roseus]|uniref:Uncharacterized protein n=1 Tax=Catharanthus roseus TaxID=4058 RepID=A0ACC0B6C6_CATRO|nr:hypothetical protein M9H77_18063 [Catharanthus roseus]